MSRVLTHPETMAQRPDCLAGHSLPARQCEAAREAEIAERVKALTGNGWPKEVNYLGARALVLELELNEFLKRIIALEKKSTTCETIRDGSAGRSCGRPMECVAVPTTSDCAGH